MLDAFNRNIDYMRVSITDRCNLRCIYCMPGDGVELTAHKEILTFDEIVRVCQNAVAIGVRKIKITGGEPLVRKDAPKLLKVIKAVPGIEEVTLTTNGILLGDHIEELASCGIDGINVSLDTPDRKMYQAITGFDQLPRVLESIDKVLEYKDIPLKINCVPMNISGQKLIEMVSMAKDKPVHVRFIEMMPIGYGRKFAHIGELELVKLISEEYGTMVPYNKKLGNGPCRYYQIKGFQGKIGFISAISHQFCTSCNRIRLTSQGFLKTCLQYELGCNLKPLLRNGVADEEIVTAMQDCILKKPQSHAFLAADFNIPGENRLLMSKIGG